MRGPSFLSDRQLMEGMVFGIKTDSETDLDYDKAAGENYQVWDELKETRTPIFIRIQVLGAQAVKYAEDMGACSANQFTGVLAGTSGSTDDGNAMIIEYKYHIPKNIYLYAANAYRVAVTKRYAQQN